MAEPPAPVIPRPLSYERATPIFDRRRRQFHALRQLESHEVVDDALLLRVSTVGGGLLHGRITFQDTDVARVQWKFGCPPGQHQTEMLDGGVPRRPLTVRFEDGLLLIDAGGPVMTLGGPKWQLAFGDYQTHAEDTSLVEPIAERSGWCLDGPDVRLYETWKLRPGEHLVGLGERFLGPNLRGRRLTHWIDEAFGTNTTDRVYKSVPLVLSDRGYGLFVHNSEEAVFDCGSGSAVSASVLVHADEIDLFVMLGDPKRLLESYTALTGRSPEVPEWSFGIWMSKCVYESREEVAAVLERCAEIGLPVSVVNLDPGWLANREGEEIDFCDFVWNEKAFGPIEEFTAWLHGQGIKVCLWVNPNLLEGLDAFQRDRLVGDGRARDAHFPRRAFVDLTEGTEGRRWWAAEVRKLFDAGVDLLKLDYGEVLPPSATMGDGRTGAQVHNLYPLLASQIAYEQGVQLTYTRAGTAGSQRYPLHWPGDAQSNWDGLVGSVRGGIASAWSGFAHWTTDIAGFFRRDVEVGIEDPEFGFSRPEPELFIRWTQLGNLLSHTRYHGIGGREPWLYGDDAVEVAVAFAQLRKRLVPYLVSCSEEASRTGTPMIRPMALEFPEDRGAWDVDTAFLLGPSLAVYPVLEPGGRVDVYVPPGTWTDHFTGEVYEGPRWVKRRGVPLHQLPLLVREGHTPFAPETG